MFSIIHQSFNRYHTNIFILTVLVIFLWIYNKFRVNRLFFSKNYSMKGKTVLITGGAGGMGYEIAKDMLQHDARVIIADYDMKKGSQVVSQLCLETHCDEQNIRLMQCDLRSFESVRNFVRLYDEQEEKLDVLICNAGIAWAPDFLTSDNINTIIQVNYLSHFLLTNLLLKKLKRSQSSRIVFVASGAHRMVWSIDWTDAFTQYKNFHLWCAYPVSKAFMLLFAHKLKRDLASSNIDVFAVNPSWVWTSIQVPMRQAIGFIPFLICYPILYVLKCILSKTPKIGAQTTIFCAVEPTLQHSPNLYFEDCAVETVSSLCRNNVLAEQLWELSSKTAQL